MEIESLDLDDAVATPPTWQMDEHGNAVADISIGGEMTHFVITEPTMETIDALAVYAMEHPGSAIKAQLLCISLTMQEPKHLSFADLCKLPFREGKEVLAAAKMFPEYNQG